MSTAAPPSTTAPWSGATDVREDDGSRDKDGPGHLRIDPRVVQKLAAQAANEVDGVSLASAGPVTRALHRPVPEGSPVDQLEIDLHLAVTIRYPLSLRVVVERLAAHVARRVEQLTGRPVGNVHVSVRSLGGSDVAASRPRVR